MARWLPSPVGGYGTIVTDGPEPDEEPLPVRLQGRRPALSLHTGVAVTVADLPRGELCRFSLDGEPVDLTTCRVETCDPDRGEVDLLVPAGDSPVEGRPLRLGLRLGGPRTELRSSAVVGPPRSFHRVDCLQHDGSGGLRLSVWGGEGPGHFPAVVVAADTLTVRVEVLDASRPPYLLVMPEYFTSGLWDLATADAIAEDPVELHELNLTPPLRARIRAWHDRWEERADEGCAEAEAIAAQLRARWPGSVVLVHHY